MPSPNIKVERKSCAHFNKNTQKGLRANELTSFFSTTLLFCLNKSASLNVFSILFYVGELLSSTRLLLSSAPTSKATTPPLPSQAGPTPPFDGVKSPAVKIGQIQTATGGTIKQDSCGMA